MIPAPARRPTGFLSDVERECLDATIARVGGDPLLHAELLTWAELARRDAEVLDLVLAGRLVPDTVLVDGKLRFRTAPPVVVAVSDEDAIVVDLGIGAAP